MDVLLPRTDAGVAFQAALAATVLAAAFFAVRKDRELRHFVTVVAVMALAFFGLRALH